MVLDNNFRNNMVRKKKLKSSLKQVCFYCNCNNPLYLTIDHKTPKSRGGYLEDPKNVVMCCWLCNQLKGSLTVNEFKEYIVGLVNLHKLYKINIVWPIGVSLEFKQNHHPLEESEKDIDE